MAATKLVFFLSLLFIIEVQIVKAQAINGCGGGCSGYGFCGGFYPTVVETNDNDDPLDILLPVLLLAICNRVSSNGIAPVNNLNGGLSETVVTPPNGCFGGCSGGCNGGCGGTCNGCCNGNGCSNIVVEPSSARQANPCCNSCGCC